MRNNPQGRSFHEGVQLHPPATLPSRKQVCIQWIGIIDVTAVGNCEIIEPDVT